MTKHSSSLSLLEILSKQAECEYLSDLHFLTDSQKAKLAIAVQSLNPADASLLE